MESTWQGPGSHRHVAWDPTFQPRSGMAQGKLVVGLLKEEPRLCESKRAAMNGSEGSSSFPPSVSCRYSPK